MAQLAAMCIALQPAVGFAQDKGAFQKQAKATAAKLRALGEPNDRCSAGALVGDGGIVTRRLTETTLQPGDKIVSINQVDLSTKGPDEFVAVLRTIGPNATVAATVRRNGELVALQIACANSRSFNEVMLAGFDQAASGKFDDCVATLGQRADLGAAVSAVRTQCASFAKNADRFKLAQLAHDTMRMAIEEAAWATSMRPAVADRLHNIEGQMTDSLGAAKFNELVDLTRAWPGEEQTFAARAPDWALFRRASETALMARLIDPESARIEWPYGFLYGTWKPLLNKRIEGYWTCGLINARNRMGGYTGSTSFVVVLDRAGSVLFVDMGRASDSDILSAQCVRSAKLLPPPPPDMRASAATGSVSPVVSLADELQKLVVLRNSGALSDAEFDTAKKKLLGAPN